jgi:molybdopterin converting factor small subunit
LSFSADNLADTPPALIVFGLAAHLSELTMDLKESVADQNLIDDLNRYFGNLREVVGSPESELIEPAVERFSECLHAISEARPMLFAKTCDLRFKVRAWVDRLTGKVADEGLPF